MFFNEYNDSFKKEGSNYIFCKNVSKTKLTEFFLKSIISEIKKYVNPYNILDLNYYFIIGSCFPYNNVLLNFKDGYFPAKLSKLIESKYSIKYSLKETDIKIDILYFNEIFNNIFDTLFNRKKLIKLLGKEYRNVFFIQHNKLDCYIMYKTIKKLYGKTNCINLHEVHFKDSKVIINSVNEMIDKYIVNKRILYQSDIYTEICTEIEQYLIECFKDLSNG